MRRAVRRGTRAHAAQMDGRPELPQQSESIAFKSVVFPEGWRSCAGRGLETGGAAGGGGRKRGELLKNCCAFGGRELLFELRIRASGVALIEVEADARRAGRAQYLEPIRFKGVPKAADRKEEAHWAPG